MHTENGRLDNGSGRRALPVGPIDLRRLPQFKRGTLQTMPLDPTFQTLRNFHARRIRARGSRGAGDEQIPGCFLENSRTGHVLAAK
jgi:hypothetical protein